MLAHFDTVTLYVLVVVGWALFHSFLCLSFSLSFFFLSFFLSFIHSFIHSFVLLSFFLSSFLSSFLSVVDTLALFVCDS